MFILVTSGETKSLSLPGIDLSSLTILGLPLGKIGFGGYSLGDITQKLSQALSGGLSDATGVDVFGNGAFQLFKSGMLIQTAQYIDQKLINELSTLLENIFAKLGLKSAADGMVELDSKFSNNEVSASGTISTNNAFAFVL